MTPTPPSPPGAALRAEAEGLVGDPGETQDPQPDAEPQQPQEPVEDEPAVPEPVRTGAVRVDEVIRAVEELEERPIEEHVGVFESAQVQLRQALDDPGEDLRDGPDDPA